MSDVIEQIVFKTRSNLILEKDVGDCLEVIFNGKEIVHNKKHKELGFRPDFFVPDENLIVEFDGPLHYTQNKIAETDFNKGLIIGDLEFNVVRIPYWLQLNEHLVSFFFRNYANVVTNDFNSYPCGFVHDKAVLPGNFSSLGLVRLKHEFDWLDSFDGGYKITTQILATLIEKLVKGHTFTECFPINFYGNHDDLHYIVTACFNDDEKIHSIIDEGIETLNAMNCIYLHNECGE